jgi:hypothetical protein
MSKGGFLSALLAQRHSLSTTGFAWRSLYYIYIGIPLLGLYYIVFHAVLGVLTWPILTLAGRGFAADYQERAQAAWARGLETGDFSVIVSMMFTESWLIAGLKFAIVVAMYHFGFLDVLLRPVYYITSV